MRDSDVQNFLRLLNQLNRVTRETIIIDNGEIVNGVMASNETRATVNGGNVEIDQTSYLRVLDCGHVANPSAITAVCLICNRHVCNECLSRCEKCRRLICNRCSKVFSDKKTEKVLCTDCEFGAKWESKIGSVFGFFVKVKEEK